MRVRFVLSEVGIGLRRNLTMTIAVVVTVSISLALLGAGLLLREQVSTMKDVWYDKVEVSVFLCKADSAQTSCAGGAVTEEQRDAIRGTLEELPQVERVYYESQEEALKNFKEQFANNPDLVENVAADFLPESFRVKLKDPTQFDVVQGAVGGMAGVDVVSDQRAVLERFFRVLDGLRNAALAIAVVQAAAAILLIANTIRVAAFSRRRETGIMRLVGASNFYIQLPFLLEAVFAALVGALLATLALVFVQAQYIEGKLRESFQFVSFIGWSEVWTTIPWLVVSAVLISGLAAFLTLRRYLRV